MRTTSFIICAAIMILTAASAARGEQRSKANDSSPRISKFACSLTALDAAQRARHKELTGRLREAVKGVRETRGGYAFALAADSSTIIEVAEWVTLERLCCPFLAFRLDFGSADKPASLEITGPEGVKEFMRLEFDIKL